METSDLVIVTGVVVVGTSLVRDVKQGKPKAPPLIFGFFMVASLLLMGLALPKVTRGLCYLALVGAFVVNGPSIFDTASSLTKAGASTVGAANVGPNPPQQTSARQGGGSIATQP
jgi:hypothetical protein